MSSEMPPVDGPDAPKEGGAAHTPTTPESPAPEGAADARRSAAKLDYEMGLSLRVIGSKYGVSGTAIGKWAKEGGWVKGEAKPVPPKPRAQPEAPVAKVASKASNVVALHGGAVGDQVGAGSHVNQPEVSTDNRDDNSEHDKPLDEMFRARVEQMLLNPTRDQAVEVAAAAVVQTVMAHRRGVQKVQAIVDKLASQLDVASDMRDLIELAICESTEPGKYRTMLLGMVDLKSHAATAKDLSTAMVKLVALERQTFGLGVTENPTPPEAPEALPTQEAGVFDAIRQRARDRIAAMERTQDVQDVQAKP